MPLSINVGLSRKASKDFQSTGVSINVAAELDQALLTRPDDLQRRIAYLYRQAQLAMDHQGATPEPQPQPLISRPAARASATTPSRSNGNGRAVTPMTESQRKAILAISRRAGIDASAEARDVIGVELDDLSIRQASELIDHLKATQPDGNGRNGR